MNPVLSHSPSLNQLYKSMSSSHQTKKHSCWFVTLVILDHEVTEVTKAIVLSAPPSEYSCPMDLLASPEHQLSVAKHSGGVTSLKIRSDSCTKVFRSFSTKGRMLCSSKYDRACHSHRSTSENVCDKS